MSKLIAAIEIGSSKIIGAVGQLSDDDTLSIVAIEEQPLTPGCVRHGCVVNVEEVSSKLNIVKRLLENNRGVAPGKITGAYIGMGGRSFASHPAEASRAFGQETEITETVVTDLRSQVLTDKSSNKKVLDSVPLAFIVDGKKISVPVGTLGFQIRARYNLIVCDEKIYKNIKTAFDKIGLKIMAGIARILAVDSLILSKDQRGLGCAIIDVGAETTTVAVYKDNALRHLATIPMGSRLITKDLAALLNITEERAEELKLNHVNLNAAADTDNLAMDKTLDNIDYKLINNIVKARASEIIANINYQINQSHIKPDELTEGIILLGKGSRLNGFRDLLKKNLGVRIAYPASTLNVSYSQNLSVPVSEALDVVAILTAAAKSHQAKECVQQPASVIEPIIETEEPVVVTKKEKANKKDLEKGPNWAHRITRSFIDLLNTSDEFDPDEE